MERLNFALFTVLMLLWSPNGFTAEVSCSSSFNKGRVFSHHSFSVKGKMKEALKRACENKLSGSQIVGRVVRSCIKECHSDKSCRQACLGTIQKMAKESERIKNLSTARR